MPINTVGHFAEAAFHHLYLSASYGFVIVKLCAHSAKDLPDKDFQLARKIEEVVMWQPAPDREGPLDGTPDDTRFRYLKYD